jgi:Domain of unknown function (DUF4136)
MRRWIILLAALPMLAWAQKVTMEFDQDSDFFRFKTFYINEGQINAKNPALNNDLVRKKIQAEIRRRLAEKGLVEVTSGQRDINVRFSLGSARRQEVDVYPARWWGTRRVVTGYTEGTLVIDLRDTKQKSLVWRAIAVEDKSDAPHIESKLDDMVKKAFDRYPPKK